MDSTHSDPPDTAVSDHIHRRLSAGETVLWAGQPRQGILLLPSDRFVIPCSVLFAVLVVGGISAAPSSSDRHDLLFNAVLFFIVAYICIGRFFHDAHVRRQTWYAVTNRRVVTVLHTLLTRRVRSMPFERISELTLVDNQNETGAIYLGRVGHWMQTLYPPNVPLSGIYLPTHLHCVEQPRIVYDLIQNHMAHRDARSN